MPVSTYDANEVTVVADGKFTTGFAEGSMVEWSKDDENFSAKTDAQGYTSVAKNNKQIGTITINLSQVSPSLAHYKKLANTNKIFPMWVTGTGEKIGGTQCMVKKTPDGTFSDEIEDRSIEVAVFDYIDQ